MKRSPIIERVIFGLKDLVPNAFTVGRNPIEKPVDRGITIQVEVDKDLKIGEVNIKPDESEIYRVSKHLIEVSEKYLEPLINEAKRITSNEWERIDRDIRKYGVEALAWYRPFHYEPVDLWGIYITLDGLKYLVYDINKKHILPLRDSLKFAYEILWQHEVFHFFSESFATRAEFFTRTPIYVPYMQTIYEKQYPNCLEEALANRHVYGRKSLSLIRNYLKIFFDNQPGSYREYRSFLGGAFKIGKTTLCNTIISTRIQTKIPLDEIEPLPDFNVKYVPTYIVTRKRIEEIPDVLYLVVKTRKLIKYLEKKGCEKIRQRGSHAQYRVGNRIISISIHGKGIVHPKIVNEVIRALGITRDEFLKEL